MPRLFIFGIGYTGCAVAAAARDAGYQVIGTTRSGEGTDELRRLGVAVVPFDGTRPSKAVRAALPDCTHVLSTVAPDREGPVETCDPVLRHHRDDIDRPHVTWAGYLSSGQVYGDHDGAFVTEETPPHAPAKLGARGLAAESAWRALDGARRAHVFRLGGIYGPERNVLKRIKSGDAERVVQPGKWVSRMHVDDVAAVVLASMQAPRPGRIYNVADDEPAPRDAPLLFAAELLGVPPPPPVELARSKMAARSQRDFNANKRLDNSRIKDELGVRLRYPSYRAGLRAIFDAGAY